MNRSTFLKRALGAVAALFVPWKAGAGEPVEEYDEPFFYGDEFRKVVRVCPRCNGREVIGNMEFGHHADGIIPEYKPYEERPCPLCQGSLGPDELHSGAAWAPNRPVRYRIDGREYEAWPRTNR